MSTPVAAMHPDAQVAHALGLGGAARWKRRAKWLAAFVVLAAVVVGAGWGWRRAQKRNIAGYVTALAERGDLLVSVTATGNVQPENSVDVGAETSGRIVSVKVDFNDIVKKGQLLAEIDPEPWRLRLAEVNAQVAVARASIAQGEATLAEAEQNLARTQGLADKGYVAPQQAEAARAAREKASALLQAAKAQLGGALAAQASAQSSLRRTMVYSPMSGVVLARHVEKGQSVVAAFATPVLFTIAEDVTHMTLHVNIDEADVGRVRAGQKADFTVDAYPGRRFPAVIKDVRNSPKIIQNVVTYDAVLGVDNPEKLLRPGMTATAVIATETRRDVLLVPNAALRFSPPPPPGAAFRPPVATAAPAKRDDKVWTEEGGALRSISVQTGPTDGERTEIVGGLEEGTTVIVDVERRVP